MSNNRSTEGADDVSSFDYPVFIGHEPPGEDLLEGKSQEKVAASLAKLMSRDDFDSRLIGLDGEWGTGKSNLVKILSRELEESHHVFVYDAWGHQEDPQRRAFLEELTADLCNADLIPSKKWNKKLKKLLSRSRETVTQTRPRLSYGIIVTALVAILTPVAKVISETLDGDTARVVTAAAPFLFAVTLWLGASGWKRRWLGITEIYAIYREQDVTHETNMQISEREPSVAQFQEWMSDLANSLSQKKLLIVFDNMDRLLPEKIHELWSSIHTFFAERNYKGVWVLVPFDRAQIAAAFEDNAEVSEQFLSKSFAVTFRVAPPVLTDWQRFFEIKFREAFGNSKDEDLPIVRQAFDLLTPHITPRRIINFVNDVVANCLVAEDTIPIRYIALFALRKQEILSNPVNQIVSLEFLGNVEPIFRDDDDLRNNIAALVYNVPVESASQVAVQREMLNAIRDRNHVRFNELAGHYHFVPILEKVVSLEDVDVDSAVAALFKLSEEQEQKEDTEFKLSAIWDALCVKEMRNPRGDQNVTTTHRQLFMNCSEDVGRKLLDSLLQNLRSAEGFEGSHYGRAMLNLSEILEAVEWEAGPLTDHLQEIKKDPEDFVDYVGATESRYSEFKLTCDESELEEYLLDLIPDRLEGADKLKYVVDEYDLTAVLDEMQTVAKSTSISMQNLRTFFAAYKAISQDKPITPLTDQYIEALYKQAESGSPEEIELASMRVARASEFPNRGGPIQALIAQNDESKVAKIAARIEYYATYGDLLLKFLGWKQPILKAVLRNLTLNSYGVSKLSITKVLPHFDDLCKTLEIPPEDFINRLDGWSRFAIDEIDADNVTSIVRDVELVATTSQSDDAISTHIVETIIEYLESLEISDWESPLRDEDSWLFQATYHLLVGEQLKRLPENAVSAYKELLYDVAKGAFVPRKLNKWNRIYQSIHKAKLKAVAKNVRDSLITEVDVSPSSFRFLSTILLDNGDLGAREADVARRILAPIVHDDKCLDDVIKNADKYAHIIVGAGDDASELKDTLKQKAMVANAGSSLIRFAASIGIEGLPEPSNEQSGEDS